MELLGMRLLLRTLAFSFQSNLIDSRRRGEREREREREKRRKLFIFQRDDSYESSFSLSVVERDEYCRLFA